MIPDLGFTQAKNEVVMEEDVMEIDLQAYWLLLRRWLWLIVLLALVAGGTSYGVSSYFVTPIYQAATRIAVQPSSSLSGSTYSDILAGQYAATSYAQMITASSISEEALRRLGYSEEAIAQELIPFTLSAATVRDTQLIDIKVESPDPYLAANLANTIAQVFIEQNKARQTARFAEYREGLNQEIQAVEGELAQLRTRLEQTPAADRAALETEIARKQDLINRYTQAYQNVQLAELQATDLISVVQPATVPDAPVRPRKMQNALLAAVVAGMLGVGFVFLREYLDTSVKAPEEAEALLQAPVLGQIWLEKNMAKGNGTAQRKIVITNPVALTAEAFRVLRTNLQFASVDQPLRTLLVSSAGPSEGKSTVTLNLALALGAAGKRVIVVDADMRRPQLYKYAEVRREPGLSDALVDRESPVTRYLQPIPELDAVRVLPPGRLPPNPTDLLGSRRMGELLAECLQQADVVILDSPPILAAADTPVLAAQVDGALVVLEAGGTDRRMVRDAYEQMQRAGARILGSVMNKVPQDGKHGYYYYYYYYSDEHKPRSFWDRLFQSKNRRQREHRRASSAQ